MAALRWAPETPNFAIPHMNSLERTLVTKSGYDHGWEVVVESTAQRVRLASALHRAHLEVLEGQSDGERWRVRIGSGALGRELRRVRGAECGDGDLIGVATERDLGLLLHDAAKLARALPDAPEARFAKTVAAELAERKIGATEVERLVKQRVGQDIFRESLMDYWGGACAVTGIAVPELLRASHAKAWAECATDAERLNVYNGFLLCAHLDALFDSHLLTFTDSGDALFAAGIDDDIRPRLGLTGTLKLRWLAPEHREFLAWHRARFESRK